MERDREKKEKRNSGKGFDGREVVFDPMYVRKSNQKFLHREGV